MNCLLKEKGCLRDSMLNDFIAYRQWYGLVPPEHERSIKLGDLGHFNSDGKFVKVGGMFDASEGGKWGNSREWSEEIVSDPFVSTTTGWARVPDEKLGEYLPLYSI